MQTYIVTFGPISGCPKPKLAAEPSHDFSMKLPDASSSEEVPLPILEFWYVQKVARVLLMEDDLSKKLRGMFAQPHPHLANTYKLGTIHFQGNNRGPTGRCQPDDF